MDERVQFAQMLQRFRAEKGFSQSKLSRRAGVTVSLICHYEAGRRHPNYDTVLALARAMELTPYETAQLLVSAGYGSDTDLVALSLLLEHPDLPESAREPAKLTIQFLRELLEKLLSETGQVQDGQEEVQGGSQDREPAAVGRLDQ